MKAIRARAGLLALAAALLVAVSCEGLFQSGWGQRAESLYGDLWHRLAGQRAAAQHVTLVMIDDASLAAFPDEPLAFWTPHFAKALDTLTRVGAKTVALDFLFSGSPERWLEKLQLAPDAATRSYDQPFRTQLNRGTTLLAAFRVGQGDQPEDYILPSPDYLLALPDYALIPHVGLANLQADPDGVVRRFVMTEPGASLDGMPRLTLGALAALRQTNQAPETSAWKFGSRQIAAGEDWPIAFLGPPGSIPVVSFRQLTQEDALQQPAVQALKDKMVLIGAGYAGMNDVHPTPYSTTPGSANALMAGPEIQATIAETLLSGRFVEKASATTRIAALVLTLCCLAGVGIRLPMTWAIALGVALALGWTLAAYGLFRHDWLFPLAHLQLGILLTLGALFLIRLTREERERSRLSSMFGRYVSPQVMTALMASPDLPELGGQSMRLTVLFSDIRNFTTLSEKLQPKEVVEMLNAYFERACAALLVEGATIDKFIGDAIMAEFGAPLSQPDHALRAIRAAVALRQVALDFRGWVSQRFAGRELPEFDIGIGIHTGDAVVGNLGASSRMEYTAIGDTVNTASRLEGMTKETGAAILASEETVNEAGGDVIVGTRHTLFVKGRRAAVPACEIRGVSTPAPR